LNAEHSREHSISQWNLQHRALDLYALVMYNQAIIVKLVELCQIAV